MVYCLLRSDLSPILAIICICTVYDCVNGTLPSAFLFVAVFKVEYYCDIIIQVTLVFTEKTRIETETGMVMLCVFTCCQFIVFVV